MLNPPLPTAVANTWASSLTSTLGNVDASYLQPIDSVLASSTIPGLSPSSSFLTLLNYIGYDLQAADTLIQNITGSLNQSLKNCVVSLGSSTYTSSTSVFSFNSASYVRINGQILTITGSVTAPTSSFPTIVYASSTAISSFSQTNSNSIQNTAAMVVAPTAVTSQMVEIGLLSLSGTSVIFTPVPSFRTYIWNAAFPNPLSVSPNSSVLSSSFFIPSTAVLHIGSIIYASSSIFVNPTFVMHSLVTSSAGYFTNHIVGVNPVFFPTGTVTSTFVTSVVTSTSGTVTSITSGTVTSTLGVTAFLATGTGEGMVAVAPLTGTFILWW